MRCPAVVLVWNMQTETKIVYFKNSTIIIEIAAIIKINERILTI